MAMDAAALTVWLPELPLLAVVTTVEVAEVADEVILVVADSDCMNKADIKRGGNSKHYAVSYSTKQEY